MSFDFTQAANSTRIYIPELASYTSFDWKDVNDAYLDYYVNRFPLRINLDNVAPSLISALGNNKLKFAVVSTGIDGRFHHYPQAHSTNRFGDIVNHPDYKNLLYYDSWDYTPVESFKTNGKNGFEFKGTTAYNYLKIPQIFSPNDNFSGFTFECEFVCPDSASYPRALYYVHRFLCAYIDHDVLYIPNTNESTWDTVGSVLYGIPVNNSVPNHYAVCFENNEFVHYLNGQQFATTPYVPTYQYNAIKVGFAPYHTEDYQALPFDTNPTSFKGYVYEIKATPYHTNYTSDFDVSLSTHNENEQQLFVEIGLWETKRHIVYVDVPNIDASCNRYLTIYWDNTLGDNTDYVGETGSTPAKQVWTGYEVVYHFSRSAELPVVKDSSPNERHGTAASSGVSAIELPHHKGLRLDSTNGTISIPSFTLPTKGSICSVIGSSTEADEYSVSPDNGFALVHGCGLTGCTPNLSSPYQIDHSTAQLVLKQAPAALVLNPTTPFIKKQILQASAHTVNNAPIGTWTTNALTKIPIYEKYMDRHPLGVYPTYNLGDVTGINIGTKTNLDCFEYILASDLWGAYKGMLFDRYYFAGSQVFLENQKSTNILTSWGVDEPFESSCTCSYNLGIVEKSVTCQYNLGCSANIVECGWTIETGTKESIYTCSWSIEAVKSYTCRYSIYFNVRRITGSVNVPDNVNPNIGVYVILRQSGEIIDTAFPDSPDYEFTLYIPETIPFCIFVVDYDNTEYKNYIVDYPQGLRYTQFPNKLTI